MRTHLINGITYPSVTTILDATKPNSERLQLLDKEKEYDKKNGKGVWKKRSQKRMEEGKIVHCYFEKMLHQIAEYWKAALEAEVEIERARIELQAWLNGESSTNGNQLWLKNHFVKPSIAQDLQEYATAITYFLTQIPPFKVAATEEVIYHPELEYAGTPDAIIEFHNNGKQCLIDLKTFEGYQMWNGYFQSTWECWKRKIKGKSRPDEPGWEWCTPKYRDALLQTCLYKLARDLTNPVREIYIVVACKSEQLQALPFPPRLWEDCKKKRSHELGSSTKQFSEPKK